MSVRMIERATLFGRDKCENEASLMRLDEIIKL